LLHKEGEEANISLQDAEKHFVLLKTMALAGEKQHLSKIIFQQSA
jgi:hypothetical protein